MEKRLKKISIQPANLLKIEFIKIANYKTFWILIGLYILVLGLIIFGIQDFINNITINKTGNSSISIPKVSIYTFPDIWHNLTFIAGYLKIILAMLILIIITNEFSYNTIRQNIISGLSKLDFIFSKIQFIFLISIFAGLLVFLLGLYLGVTNSSAISLSLIFKKSQFIFAYFLEIFTYLVFAFFIGILFKKTGLSIGLFFLYSIIIEPIICYKLPASAAKLMPLKSVGNLIHIPNSAIMKLVGVKFQEYVSCSDVLIAIFYAVLFCILSYLILLKRDL